MSAKNWNADACKRVFDAFSLDKSAMVQDKLAEVFADTVQRVQEYYHGGST